MSPSGSDSRRFEFGANWRAFLSVVNDERIAEAQRSLADMLGSADLTGLTFLDIGCGSGLFSLAARRMGARVRSFDFDRLSVNCASEGSGTTSTVVRPDGTLQCYQPYGQEGLLVADLDLSTATGLLASRCRISPL